jgi:segregation and condensation protein A
MVGSGATTDDGAGEGARTPIVTLAGYSGSLAALLTLARTHQIDLATMSIVDLVDQLAAAVQDAPATTALAQKGDWLVMAAWLVQLRSRLLLPAEASEQLVAQETAGRFRERLTALATIQALAGWLEARPQLGRDVFVRGQDVETFELASDASPAIDVIEFLWASMALFDGGIPASDGAEIYRPPARELYAIPEARARILRRLSDTPAGMALDQLLPSDAAKDISTLRKRSAWASTLIASLELAKQGAVTLAQTDLFTAVHVTPWAHPAAWSAERCRGRAQG